MLKFTDMAPKYLSQTKTSAFIETFFNAFEEHRKRISLYQLYWSFYEGEQWMRSVELPITINYVKRLIDEKVTFFTKNAFEISIPEDASTKADIDIRSEIKSRLDRIWKSNGKSLFLNELAMTGSIGGDVFVKVAMSELADGSLYPSAEVLHPAIVFPEFNKTNKKKVERVHIIYPVIVEEIEFTNGGLFGTRSRIEPSKKDRWIRETWTADSMQLFHDDVLVETRPNLIKEIPIVHIKNFPDTNSSYGVSDVAILISPQKALNENITHMAEIVDYFADPQFFAKGLSIQEIEKGADNLWSTPSTDADVTILRGVEDLKAVTDLHNTLYRSMLDVSGVPEQAVNPTKNVSNTPGVALHMAYLPLINVRAMKELLYGAGIQSINRLMLKYQALISPEFSDKLEALGESKYDTDISFGEDLPRDEVQADASNQQRLTMGITSRKQILVSMGVGPEDAERIIKEADADAEIRLSLLAKYGAKEGDAFGKNQRPDPVIQGDKVSTQSQNG